MSARLKVFVAVLVLGVAATVAATYAARRTYVVGLASLGEPPRRVRAADLVGGPVPAFEAEDVNGRRVGTVASRGRVMVVTVWATWCPPCREEMARLERDVWRRFGGEVDVIGISYGDTPASIATFNQRAKLTFPLVADRGGRLSRRFEGNSVPRTYVVDRSGRIVHQAVGYDEQSFAAVVAAVKRVARGG